jgi:hypothetical protein
MRFKISKKILLVLVLVLLATIPTAYALSQLFQQSVPSQQIPAAVLVSQCSALTLNGTVSAASGNLLYGCFSGGTAIYAWYPVQNSSVTPIFSLPSPYTALHLATTSSQCPAQGTPTGLALTNGTSFTVNTKTGAQINSGTDYCISYSSTFGATLPSFTIAIYQ